MRWTASKTRWGTAMLVSVAFMLLALSPALAEAPAAEQKAQPGEQVCCKLASGYEMTDAATCPSGSVVAEPPAGQYVGAYGYCKPALVMYENQGPGEGVQNEGPGYYFPKDYSKEGHRIDWLINVTMVMVIFLFVIMCIWIAWSMIFHDEKNTADYDHGSGRSHVLMALGISAVIFFIVDGNLFYNSMVDLEEVFWNWDLAQNVQEGENAGEARPECGMGEGGDSPHCATRIQINGRQWAWEARYSGPDGVFNTADDVVTLNEVVVPVDAPVIFELAAVDVIHSFNLPNLRQKMDAVPGVINRLWFEAKDTGEVEIACAQHCGSGHYKMRGWMKIMSRDDYGSWAREAMANALQAYDPEDFEAHWGWDWRNR